MQRLSGDARDVWCNLHDMVHAMGPDGVSSDEEAMADNKRVYHVKVLPHCSARILSRVIFINSHANHMNGYGNNGPGTAPQTRITQIYLAGKRRLNGRRIFTRVDGWKSDRTFIMGT
jgi:hypothetical protein